MSIPSFPPPSYDEVIEMDMMKRCNEIWSKFDGVMEKYEVKSKKNFFSLPSHIREMIWKIKNRELDEKFENLGRENDYNKKFFMFEFTSMVKEYYGFIGNPCLDEKGGLKLTGVVVCPRVEQMIYDDFDGTWFRWGDEIGYDEDGINACSSSWFEMRTKECKMKMLEMMKEEFEEDN